MHAQLRNEGSSQLARSPDRGRMTLPVSLLLVGVGYVLLVAGPLLTARISPLLAPAGAGSAVPMPAAASAGIALLGAAAMVVVLASLVRDVETRPYAAIAPVLAVFSAFLLTSARAKLPFPGWASEHLGLFVLTLALLGGALISRAQSGARTLGWLLAIFPFGAVMTAFLLGAPAGPAAAFAHAEAPVQTYLTLLGLSSLALAFAGRAARTLMPSPEPALLDVRLPRVGDPEPTLLVATVAQRAGHAAAARAPTRPRDPVEPRARQPALRSAGALQGQRASAGAQEPQYGRAPQQVLSFDTAFDASFDDQAAIALMKPKRSGKLLLAVCVLGGAGASLAAYFYAQPAHKGARLVNDVAATPRSVERVQPKVEAPPVVTTEQLSDSVAPPEPVVAPLPEPVEPTPAVTHAAAAPDERRAREDRTEKEARSSSRKLARAEKRKLAAEERANAVAARPSSSDESEAKPAKAAAREEQADEPTAAQRRAAKEEAKPGPSSKAAPAAEPAPSANERDLDLDSLVHKAIKGSNGVSAADDPLLGL